MNERYSRLFSLPKNLYVDGAPLLVVAGALLKDNQTGQILAQLKLQNISARRIKGVKVLVVPNDTIGNPLDESIEHWYLDLEILRDQDFGSKEPIFCPNDRTRGFSVSVDEVLFADNSSWRSSGEKWSALAPTLSLLQEFGGSEELVRQYRIKYGNDSRVLFRREKDLWHCACGAINREDEVVCHSCGKNSDALSSMNISDLTVECQNRLKAEEIRREKESRRLEEEKKQKEIERAAKVKKARKAGVLIAIAVVAITVISVFTTSLMRNTEKNTAYNSAISLMESGEYEEAMTAFLELGDYQDSTDLYEEAELMAQYEAAEILYESGEYKEAIAAFEALGDYSDASDRALELSYALALSLIEAGEYEEAISALEELNGYSDSADLLVEISHSYSDQLLYEGKIEAAADILKKIESEETVFAYLYDYADSEVQSGNIYQAAIIFGFLGSRGYDDSKERSYDFWSNLDYSGVIAAGEYGSAAVNKDGTVSFTGIHSSKIEDWTSIVKIVTDDDTFVGITTDGTAVAVTTYIDKASSVSTWNNIVGIAVSDESFSSHIFALNSDGTVLSAEVSSLNNDATWMAEVNNWTDIVAVAATSGYTLGLKSDGTVVIAGTYSNTLNYIAKKVADWTDIVAIAVGEKHAVGLKSDGTVVSTSSGITKSENSCNTDDWSDIVAISASAYSTIGLKSDGTVVATGSGYSDGDNSFDQGQFDVEDWYNIVAISAGESHTLGLTADGTVVAVGSNEYSQCDVDGWDDVVSPK